MTFGAELLKSAVFLMYRLRSSCTQVPTTSSLELQKVAAMKSNLDLVKECDK